ncbi:hypothetical protein A5746_26275 [Mycolicibacterium conceptionense]|uniref:hypothetical protein n=1 Tax=Mycolicibacterium conceptionense TaxID=451644 RepID=UPI0007ED8956|nr:hypothetical protein [Mycolicibacterium conceptionense]OBK00048.1 hypothetical protein A5639_27580 [Mycolicibacterium conceptionense]OMB81455.1 hypothetical protein A5741_25200 [Mycolicibacterium conceptionense]OMB86901.1 hypothetical protein A5746_26275 [Mycolicibacterium conceptionense]
MDPELDAIVDAMDKTTGGGRDHALAVQLSDAYVAAHPEKFTMLATLSIEACVQLVDTFRAAEEWEALFLVEAWLLHHFEPQTIGGPIAATIRTPGSED